MKPLELYIHIPFCVQKCKYCDFLSAPSCAKERQEYVESLCEKIRSYGEFAKTYCVVSVFVGGGTPSILESSQIEKIFAAAKETFSFSQDAEITIEMNPGAVTREKLQVYHKLGINRLSIGLQSVNDSELKELGRIHTYQDFLDTYQLAREEGFENINIDLISAIPHQTVESWEETLEKVCKLEPEHISAYSLIIEEGTAFYERYGEGEHDEELPTEEEERQMYYDTKTILASHGYERYEISNYAKKGYACQHNLGYWSRTEYLGLGLGAASLVNNCRWVEGEEKEELTKEEQMEEFMFLGLRKIQGVSEKEFLHQFGVTLESVYESVLKEMLKKELIEREKGWIRLTEKGIDVSNYVMSEFLL